MPLKEGLSAREVAELHYKFLEENNYEGWLETLIEDIRERASFRGSTADFWWNSGHKMVDYYGVTYVFQREVPTGDPKRKKFFFRRLNPDGSPRGMPVPIRLVLEKKEWRVEQASY